MKTVIPTITLLGATVTLAPIFADAALKSFAVIALAIVVIARLGRASAAFRHTVWLFTLVGLLALPLLSVSLPKWQVLPASFSLVKPAPSGDPPFSEPVTFAPPAPALGITPPATPDRVRTETAAAPATAPTDLGSAFLLAWAAIGGLLLLRLVVANWMLRRLASRGSVPERPELVRIFAERRTALALSPKIRLLIGSQHAMPKTFGCFRPCVLLPAEAESWSPARLEAVLAHELGHIRRHDPLTHLLVQITCAVYWFNPLVWIAARCIGSERERACDDLVLNHGFKASDYARHLLDVVAGCDADRFTACASVGMARPSRLEGRVVSILDQRINRRSLTRALGGIAIAATLVTVVPLAMIDAQEAPPRPLENPVATPPPAADEPERISPDRRPSTGRSGNRNAVDDLVLKKIKTEYPVLPTEPRTLKTEADRRRVILEFYRFFLNREPTKAELDSTRTSWTQADYHRIAERMVGVRKLDRRKKDFPTIEMQRPPVMESLRSLPAVAVGLEPNVPVPTPGKIGLGPEPVLSQPVPTPAKPGLSVGETGELRSHDRRTGKPDWIIRLPDGEGFNHPAVRGNRLYLTDQSGIVYCLDQKTGKELWNCGSAEAHKTTDVFLGYVELLGRKPAPDADPTRLLEEISRYLSTGKTDTTRDTIAPPMSNGNVTEADPQRAELAAHWMELVAGREMIRNGVKRQHQSGVATSTELNRADQAITEARIGLAKVRGQTADVIAEMSKLIALIEERLSQQVTMGRKGLISPSEILKAREALLEARIRLAEFKMGGRNR